MGHAKLGLTDRSAAWPAFLKKTKTSTDVNAEKPVVVDMSAAGSDKKLEELLNKAHITGIVDNYDEQFAELLLSRNAQLYRANIDVQRASVQTELDTHYGKTPSWQKGAWVYYPWSGRLAHVLEPGLFNDLRTIRNRDLITSAEQKILADFPVACLGMSVGSASALALGLSGMSAQLKLADGAVISGSNLNRILTGVQSVGQEKSLVIAQQIYEMNPYMNIARIGKLTDETITELFEKPWPVKAVIDEIDDLEMKIKVRIEARKRHIPVIMATELADSVMLDVERFDLEPNRELFHGLIPNVEKLVIEGTTNHREWMKHAVSIIGPSNMPISMQQSLLKIGSTVVTHPQLGATVMMTGGILSFAIKQIALRADMPSQRTIIDLQKTFQPSIRARKHKKAHKKHTQVIIKAVNNF